MSEKRVERRLAAILAGDVVGYSRLMGVDEEATLRDLKAHRRGLIDPKITEYRGRVVKTTGDGILIEFASVVDAVRFAVDVQRGMVERNADVPADRRIEFRIGINIGDVIIDGDDIFGDGVNVAARLEALAEPGGICVSRVVRDQVRDKLDFSFEDLGDQSVKNIARPVRVFRVDKNSEEEAALPSTSAEGPTLAMSERPSIAVLPFDNMSSDPEQEYFVDGIVEDIITSLSRIKWLFVIARNSSFVYKGHAVDIKQAGRDLGVRYVLEGSLRKAGTRLRITTQLIEASTGTHVWAERYDRPLGDIFDLQDEITLSVVGAIEPNLRQAEIERAKRKRPDNLDAYDLYLRALPFAQVAMPGDADKALALLEQALALEPDFAAAHALAAWCYEQRYQRGGVRDEDKVAGLYHARAAIESGADDALTLATAGFSIGLIAHDYATAMEVIDRALTLTASSAIALGFGSVILGHAGDSTRAVDYAERALRASPPDFMTYLSYSGLGLAHYVSGNFTESVLAGRRAAQANPRFSYPQVVQTAALVQSGRLDEGKTLARHVLELEPNFTIAQFVKAHTGRADIWQPIGEALRQAGLPE
ncbi:MAG: adenylate/guanylate cyclase domain-containing protein [Stellaceae bacterium]